MFCAMQRQYLWEGLHQELSVAEAESLLQTLKQYPARAVSSLLQRHGEIITVSPGTMHSVIKLRPCVKVAWKLVQPQNLGLVLVGAIEMMLHRKPPSLKRKL